MKHIALSSIVIVLFLLGGSRAAFGQITNADVDRELGILKATIPTTSDRLVTDYTFRKEFATDFSRILLNENSLSSATNYATVKVDKEKLSVTFSPFNYVLGGWKNFFWKPEEGPVRVFGNISFKGDVNGNDVTKFFTKDGFMKGYEVIFTNNILVFTGGGNNFNVPVAPAFRSLQNNIADAVAADYKVFGVITEANVVKYIKNRKALKDAASLHKAMRSAYSEQETELAKNEWKSEFKHWVGLSIGVGQKTYNRYNVKKGVTEDATYFNPSVQSSYNIFYQSLTRKWTGYFNIGIEFRQKNIFTGKSPLSWNKMQNANDTSFIVSEKKDVYLYDSTTYAEQFLPAVGAQLILLKDWSKLPLGVDISLRNEWLVPLATSGLKNSTKFTENYGIVFPINNKAGERAVNVEVFYAHVKYSDPKQNNEDFWGAKFAVPIFSK